jgi:hypothetical protein
MSSSSFKRPFSHDPLTGITKTWDYDEHTDTAVIHSSQDVEPILEQNQREYAAAEGTRFGEWTKIATLPNLIYYQLLMSGKLHDQRYMRQFLNSSEFRKFRTRPGRVSGVVGA